MRNPFSIWCSWSMHDELGDHVILDEKLAMKALDGLERWQKWGMKMDVCMLDCYWFDPTKGYLQFRSERWPDGPERFLKRIKSLGMVPGLWFATTATFIGLNVPELASSHNDIKSDYSLADGPYADYLEKALFQAVEKWGVRFFKFDFANFFISAAGVDRAASETCRKSTAALTRILRKVKDKHPDCYFFTHCGYSHSHPSSGRFDYDTGLLQVMDAMFSGDPCPYQIPQTALTRAMDIYQDIRVAHLHREGFPLDRIEDHGVMAGTTNTCFYRSTKGLRRTAVGQAARGGRRFFFYGDPNLVTKDDVVFMSKVRSLFQEAQIAGQFTHLRTEENRPLGEGWLAYITGGGSKGLAYLVNPTSTSVEIKLPLASLSRAKLLFHDGSVPPSVQVSPDELGVCLSPEQAALVGLGDHIETPSLGSMPTPWKPTTSTLADISWVEETWGFQAKVPALEKGQKLEIIASLWEGGPNLVLTPKTYYFGGQNSRRNKKGEPLATHELLSIRAYAGKKELKPFLQVPDVFSWNGTNWVIRAFDWKAAGRIEVRNQGKWDRPARLRVHARVIS